MKEDTVYQFFSVSDSIRYRIDRRFIYWPHCITTGIQKIRNWYIRTNFTERLRKFIWVIHQINNYPYRHPTFTKNPCRLTQSYSCIFFHLLLPFFVNDIVVKAINICCQLYILIPVLFVINPHFVCEQLHQTYLVILLFNA